MDDVGVLIQQVQQAGLGWYGAAAVTVVLLVRLLRMEAVQMLIPMEWQWNRLKPWARLLIVFASAFAASWLAALLSGQAPVAALAAAVPVALTAIAGHKGTQAVGHADTQRRLLRDPEYSPTALRSVVSPVLPIDRQAIDMSKAAVEIRKRSNGNGSL